MTPLFFCCKVCLPRCMLHLEITNPLSLKLQRDKEGECAMADTTKPVSTLLGIRYQATRTLVEVEPKHLRVAFLYCSTRGLQPRLRGYCPESDQVGIQVEVPHVEGKNNFGDFINGMKRELSPGNVEFSPPSHVELLRPVTPEPEPCTIGPRLGKCSCCGRHVQLIGPIDVGVGKQKFVLIRHNLTGDESDDDRCPGSGEDEHPYDGT